MMAFYAGCLAVLCACTESQELSNKEGLDEPVELQINPTMTLTGGGAREAVTDPNNPTVFAKGATIGVFAVGTESQNSNYGNGNNYAVYTLGESSAWSVGTSAGDKHIYLTSEVATIYAVSPSTVVTTAPSAAVTADATVEVETFAGGENAIDADSKNLITAAQSATNDINIAPGEKDYMYAGDTPPTASNGKGSGASTTSTVNLTMKHALAMVSFRVYKTANYKGDGHLTKIQMKNKGTNTGGSPLKLQKPANNAKAKMKISNGDITLQNTPEGITYTRYIHQATAANFLADDSDKYYELKVAATGGTENSPAFSIMLYPIPCADTSSATSDIQAIFTVDGTDYPVDIPACAWVKGTNSMYGATLDGEELSLGTVSITQWTSTTINNGLNLIQKP